MEEIEKGEFEIKIEGIKPEDFDISDLKSFLDNTEKLLYPNVPKKDREIISYSVVDGSVKNIFKTSIATIISVSSLLNEANNRNNINFLDIKQIEAISFFQNWSKKTGKKILLSNSFDSKIFKITPETNYQKEEEQFFETSLYVYGVITELGGKTKSNIHLDTEEYGVLIIDTPEYEIKKIKENKVYKEVGIEILVQKNQKTKEIKDPNFVKFLDYNNEFDDDFLNDYIEKATPKWKEVENIQEWLNDIRGITA